MVPLVGKELVYYTLSSITSFDEIWRKFVMIHPQFLRRQDSKRFMQRSTCLAIEHFSWEQYLPMFVALGTSLNMDHFLKTTQEMTESAMGTLLSQRKLYLLYKHWVLPLFRDWMPLWIIKKKKRETFLLTLENLKMCQNIHRFHIFQ